MAEENGPKKPVIPLIVPFLVLFFGALYCYGSYELVKSVRTAFLLSSHGVPAAAQVSASEKVFVMEGARPPRAVDYNCHGVEFDGHEGSILLKQEMPVGTEVSVLYLPDSPEVYVAGEAAEPVHVLWGRLPGPGGFFEKLAIKIALAGNFVLPVIGVGYFVVQGIRFVRRDGCKLWLADELRKT